MSMMENRIADDGEKGVQEGNEAGKNGDKPSLAESEETENSPIDEATTKGSVPLKDDTSPFKSPPMAFKLPANSTKAPKPLEMSKKKDEGREKSSKSVGKKDEDEAEKKEKGEVKESADVTSGSKRKSAAADLTPAQKKKYENVPIPYKEPSWSGIPEVPYHLEVLKMGKIVETIELDAKPFIVFGRLPTCDVSMEHPSLSRFHAVLQYRAVDESPEAAEDKRTGFYLMDLGSTHGTFLNKNQVEANTFIRVKTGHMFKFGGSSRYFIMQGGTKEDEEAENELSLTQLKQLSKVREEHLKNKMAEEEERERKAKERETKGATWGFADDAEEEDDDDDDEDEEIDMAKNPYGKMTGKAENQDKYADDPRKSLQNWYEREGEDLEYEFVEEGTGKKKTFFCRITLPVDAEEPVVAEGEATNKKQAKIIAALEACKILDLRGLLFQSQQESSTERRRKKLEENDFYDSDEDEFLDRTGEIEAKRRRRMAHMGVKAEEQKALTYAELVAKLDSIRDEMEDIERKLEKARKDAYGAAGGGGEDTLDAFMSAIKSGRSLDTKTRIKLKTRLQELKKEQLKVQRLADVARPANLPPIQKPTFGVQNRGAGIWVGKMGGGGKNRGLASTKPVQMTLPAKKDDNEGDYEEEEEEEEEEEDDTEDETVGKKTNDESEDDGSSMKKASIDESDSPPREDSASKSDSSDLVKDSEPVSSSSVPVKRDNASVGSKITMKIGESNSAKKMKNKEGSVSSVSSAIRVSGMDTGPKLPESKASSAKSRGPDFSVSSILSARATEAYNEERMKDPKFSMWVPPVNQAGDGKTKLNEKYGY